MNHWSAPCLALVVSLALSTPVSAADSALPPAIDCGTACIRDVPYTVQDDLPQLLDVYLPAEAEGLRPVVVFIHGGYWLRGDKAEHPEMYLPLVEAGYVVFSINYRLTDSAPYPAQIEDCKAAVRWVREHAVYYAADPQRIAAVGVSAGGHLAALLGTSGDIAELEGRGGNDEVSSRVQAVVNWFGPADLTMTAAAEGQDLTPVEQLLGGSLAETQDMARLASPTTFISPDDPPFLIIHGTEDPIVPFLLSQYFAGQLAAAGVGVELVSVLGGQHGGFEDCQPSQDELMRRVVEFLDLVLK